MNYLQSVRFRQVYKALYRHSSLSAPPNPNTPASAATIAALSDRLNVLGYLGTIAHSAEVRHLCFAFFLYSLTDAVLPGVQYMH